MSAAFQLDTTRLCEEMQWMIFLVAMESDPALPAPDRQQPLRIDWTKWFECVRHHRIYPYLYCKLSAAGADRLPLPLPVWHALQREYRLNAFDMLRLSAEMETVSRKMDERQIRVLYLKGPFLGDELYGDISHRTSCDLDMLVPLQDLREAEQQLYELGYEKDDYIQSVLNDWKWRHHHYTFYHPDKKIKIELHWRLHQAPLDEPKFSELWQRRRQYCKIQYPVYLLGREDLFLLLVSHGARHGWSRLRWLLDIRMLMEQELDRAQVFALLTRHSYRHAGGQALLLLRDLFSVRLDPGWSELVRQRKARRLAADTMFYLARRISLHSQSLPADVGKYHMRYLFRLLTWKQKLLFIASCLFPYPEDARTLPLPKGLHFLYIPLRPFLWAWRKAVGTAE